MLKTKIVANLLSLENKRSSYFLVATKKLLKLVVLQIEKKIFDFFDRKLCSENVCEQKMFQYGIKNVANGTKNVREQKNVRKQNLFQIKHRIFQNKQKMFENNICSK